MARRHNASNGRTYDPTQIRYEHPSPYGVQKSQPKMTHLEWLKKTQRDPNVFHGACLREV